MRSDLVQAGERFAGESNKSDANAGGMLLPGAVLVLGASLLVAWRFTELPKNEAASLLAAAGVGLTVGVHMMARRLGWLSQSAATSETSDWADAIDVGDAGGSSAD